MTETASEQPAVGPLNLSDADTSGFEPIPSGTELKAEVFDASWTKIKNEGGKMALDTPGLKIQAKVLADGEGSQYYNRRVFTNFWIPGADYAEKDKAAKMKGMLVNFLVAIGYTKEEVMGGSFDLSKELEEDNLQGREFILRVGVQPAREGYPAQNTFLATKSLAEAGAVESSALL